MVLERILPLFALTLGICMTVFSAVKIASTGAMGSVLDGLLTSDSLLFDGFVIGWMFIGLGAFLVVLDAR